VYNTDEDYWSFSAKAGDRLTIASETPGNPNNTGLRYDVFGPDGTFLNRFYADQFGRGELPPLTLPGSGTYFVGVYYNYAYEGEYRFRATIATPPAQIETEANDGTSTANAVTLTTAASGRTGTMAGFVRNASDLDYFSLGTVNAGETVFLTTRKPGS